MAWPRLAEYFARFKLSRGVTCSLEVLAPTLSRVPLWVQTTDANINPMAMMVGEANGQGVKTEKMDLDLFDDCRKKSQSPCRDKPNKNKQKDSPSAERLSIWKATQRFLGQNINLMNVANVCVPIKIKSPGTNRRAKPNDPSSPTMEVAVVVHGRAEDDDDELVVDDSEAESDLDSDSDPDEVDSFTGDTLTRSKDSFTDSSASMVLVRMVNKIPLLDSAEAVACGLVQGISSKKRMWNSFGLEVRMKHDGTNVGKLPTFEVRDSDQVAPFFKTGAHCLFEESQDKTASPGVGVNKRKSRSIRRTLLPASVRLGNVLVIAQIHAEPSTLPLPTLSKVC